MYMQRLLRKRATVFMSIIRKYAVSDITTKQIDQIDPFCKVQIRLPFNVSIKPLDPIDFPQSDKIDITMSTCSGENPEINLKVLAQNLVEISSCIQEYDDSVNCSISLPVKADIDVCTLKSGCIFVEKMQGDALKLTAEGSGNIQTKDIKGSNVLIRTEQGQVKCNGLLQAEVIEVLAKENGSVQFDRIQGKVLNVSSEKGSMRTASCYVNDSVFKTISGDLDLRNVHRNCSVHILENGDLNMSGFDGTLRALVNSGNVSLHAQNLEGNNLAEIKQNGQLKLYISDSVHNNCKMKVEAKCILIEDSISEINSRVKKNKLNETNKLQVNHENQKAGSEFIVLNPNGQVSVGMSPQAE